jgi:hypothetical protein
MKLTREKLWTGAGWILGWTLAVTPALLLIVAVCWWRLHT